MIERKNKSSVSTILKLTVKENDYKPLIDKQLKDYRKKASIPGFRPGTAPMSMIKGKYGKSMKVEEVNKIIQKKLYDYIVKENLKVLGSPIQIDEKIDWEEKDLIFNFEIGLSPEVEVDLSKIKVKTDYFKIKVDDKEIDNQIEVYREKVGKQNKKEIVDKGCHINGVIEFGDEKKSHTFSLDKLKNTKELIGRKKGDKVELNTKELFKDENDLGIFLQKPLEEAKKENKKFNFTIEEIFIIEKHKINQDFFDKVLGKDKVKSEEEFRNELRETSLKQLQEDADKHFLYNSMESLTEQIKFDTPDEFLKKWMIMNNKDVTEKNIEEIYEKEGASLRKQIIEGQIFKDNGIEITEEDINIKVKEVVKLQMQMYGGGDMPDDQLEEIAKGVMTKNPQEKDRVRGMIVADKLLEILKENMKYKEKEVTFKEYIEIISNKK